MSDGVIENSLSYVSRFYTIHVIGCMFYDERRPDFMEHGLEPYSVGNVYQMNDTLGNSSKVRCVERFQFPHDPNNTIYLFIVISTA